MEKTTHEWLQWASNTADPLPHTANTLTALSEAGAVDPTTLRTECFDVTRNLLGEMAKIRAKWNSGDEFVFHLHCNNELPLLLGCRQDRTRLQQQERQSFDHRLFVTIDEYLRQLNLCKKGQSVPKGLADIFGSDQKGRCALEIVKQNVHTRLATEELLHLSEENDIVQLPGMTEFLSRSYAFAVTEMGDESERQ